MEQTDVIAITPFGHPDTRLLHAASKANALGVLDPGFDPELVQDALETLLSHRPGKIALIARQGIAIDRVPADAVIILPGPDYPVDDWAPRETLAQVTSLDEARRAQAAGTTGLIAKGLESGGRIGMDTAFILLQQLLDRTNLPVWVQGGIGPDTAAACIAGGAAGVVIDSQLAMARESGLPMELKQAIRYMDGSETAIIDGFRIYKGSGDNPALSQGSISDALRGLDPQQNLIPCGQDASLAPELVARFATAGGIITGIRNAIAKAIQLVKESNPLAPDSSLARGHGIHYPVLQGPMTRVSDTPEFAEAVAAAGGLPFVALALLRGPQSSKLLEETSALLGDRPWGVGILGFVPAELRAEQLAAIEAVKPPVALIAGGRPSQARNLEEKGIPTYLHVPSPGLLTLFLKDGARRFIFEGRECGGHVGPRSSFLLWQQQLAILSRFAKPEELTLVFAGGIHDPRSAAMVAAMAAPLAARGARIGILMGTAYLFTDEAVKANAILPAYQKAALQCEKTVLLETAPGHASRCVDTEFAKAFESERKRLESEGVPRETAWMQLEQLNLGRLRIASKGVKRSGDVLVELDEAEQCRGGMYMVGDVAMLEDRVLTMAELHDRVTTGAIDFLKSLPALAGAHTKASPADIAIIGMAGAFPDAGDLDTFWSNIIKGVNAVKKVDPERWNPDFYYDPDSHNGDKTPSKWGGFIDDVLFNPLDYGIPPQSLTTVDPTQLLSLEMARRALDDAGYASREFDRSRVSVIFGAGSGSDISSAYGFRALYPQLLGPIPPELDEQLPRLSEDSFAGVLSNVIAGRIANRLDLGGSNFTVDAACASSLAALDNAVKELSLGTSDMVLCGGADLHNSINDFLLFSAVHAVSREDRCRTFDSETDGMILSEGIACLVLKRLADAERDGDRIYAVIKAVASASDGRSLGLTAPRKEGQMQALARVYDKAGVSPRRVGLVEAHGTGTVVGDRTELNSLTEIFSRAGTGAGSCALGSVKSQIGHTKCAAGMAGVIKATKALYHGILPPTINIKQPNPAFDPATSPFILSDRARPWAGQAHYATVNAFGFGGANYTTLLSVYQDEEAMTSGYCHWPSELLLFHGQKVDKAMDVAKKVLAILDSGHPVSLRDLAATVCTTPGDQVQFSIQVSSLAELREAITAVLSGNKEGHGITFPQPLEGKVAMLFPGQGAQRPGMFRELFVAFPHLRRLLATDAPWCAAMLPPTAWSDEENSRQKAALTDTRLAQPALGIAGMAVADLLSLAGLNPDMAAGHSYGELVALCRAGAISEEELIPLSRERAMAMVESSGGNPGTMAAVTADAKKVDALIQEIPDVVIANINAPEQTVISGSKEGIAAAMERCKTEGLSCRQIPVADAFHSPIVAQGAKRLRTYLDGIGINPTQFDVWSNSSAEPYPAHPNVIRTQLANHIAKPVRFVEQIESMYAAGARIFIEAGPGKIMSGLVKRILGDRPHRIIATDSGADRALSDVLAALARLAALGIPVDTGFLFQDRGAKRLDLDRPASLAPPATAWKINGWLARPLNGEPPANRLRPMPEPIRTAGSAGIPSASADNTEATVLEYLRSARELAAAQRDVMLGYLRADPEMIRRPISQAAETESTGPKADTGKAATDTQPPPPDATVAGDAPPPRSYTEMLLSIVSEKTGYPEEMLGLDQDLEAELSIDSIKRIEILGTLMEQLGMSELAQGDTDQLIEQLAVKKTLREVIDWIEEKIGTSQAESVPSGKDPTGEGEPKDQIGEAGPEVACYLPGIEPIPLPEGDPNALVGKRFCITNPRTQLGKALIRLLKEKGAAAQGLAKEAALPECDGLIYLGALGAGTGSDAARELFDFCKTAINQGTHWICALTSFGGRLGHGPDIDSSIRGAGIPGLIKSIAKEHPELHLRSIDIDSKALPQSAAEIIFGELAADSSPITVGYDMNLRYRMTPQPIETDGKAEGTSAIDLDSHSVVLVTGGARGITARSAVALARETGCKLILVGRSPRPEAEDPRFAEARDLPTLRRVFVESAPSGNSAEIDKACRRILAEREMRETFEALNAIGCPFEYHAMDVRDHESFSALIQDIYARLGRIDAVIHGAGIIEDKRFVDKSRDSFDRVYDTKVSPALTLMSNLKEDVKSIVFFSSVVGVFGNRGQVDYAAAGDFLDKLAWQQEGKRNGTRVLSIDWGPWADTGMVSDFLAREYSRQGVGLIPIDTGIEILLREMRQSDKGKAQLIVVAADLSTLNTHFVAN